MEKEVKIHLPMEKEQRRRALIDIENGVGVIVRTEKDDATGGGVAIVLPYKKEVKNKRDTMMRKGGKVRTK